MKSLVWVVLMLPLATAYGQDAPFECDNNFGECGTPNMSGGGSGGGGAILINNTDLGDTYQSADDYDDDGIEDSYDNCPRYKNPDQFDTDGDNIGDMCDNCRDRHNLNQWNIDGDDIGDLCDDDMDNDGIRNELDNCLRVHNTSQSDLDNDFKGDACDNDLDGDGIQNIEDHCPTLVGEIVDAPDRASQCFPDRDGDGIPDFGANADNCLGIYNPEQSNIDNDANGDACDPDIDNDTVLNEYDNCTHVFNVDQEDIDRDGRGDRGCDDRYCYVVYGDESNCLDPDAAFRVYSPNVSLSTTDTAHLRLFMNREHQPARYVWSIKARPSRSSATISDPTGYAVDSTLFEYILDHRPTFSPDVPGTYILILDVETAFGDNLTNELDVTDRHEVMLVVSGKPNLSSSGCNVAVNETMPPLLLLFVIFLVPIRRMSG